MKSLMPDKPTKGATAMRKDPGGRARRQGRSVQLSPPSVGQRPPNVAREASLDRANARLHDSMEVPSRPPRDFVEVVHGEEGKSGFRANGTVLDAGVFRGLGLVRCGEKVGCAGGTPALPAGGPSLLHPFCTQWEHTLERVPGLVLVARRFVDMVGGVSSVRRSDKLLEKNWRVECED